MVLEKFLIFVKFQGVLLPSHLVELLHNILGLSSGLVQISPELLDEVPISTIISLAIQRLVFEHQLLDLSFESILDILKVFLRLVLLALQLSPRDIELPLRLKMLILKPFTFLDFLFNFNTMTCLEVFLNLHAEDVSINGKLQLLRHLVHLALPHVEEAPLLREPTLKIDLGVFPKLDFLTQAFLVLCQLCLYLVVMAAKVVVELVDLLLVSCR